MTSHSPESTSTSVARLPKRPRPVFPQLLASDAPHPETAATATEIAAFPPNRDTLGGTAYFIVEAANILIDCPAWDEPTQDWLRAQGGVDWLVITHRDSIGQAKAVQKAFNCAIAIQEQEAYLLPGVEVTPFHHALTLTPQTRLIWTPGHTPGSACVYHDDFGGVLFTGRHLLPTPQGTLAPIKTAKTFHWRRQMQSVQTLIDEFSPETLQFICPGANLGFLRGQLAIAHAYAQLLNISQISQDNGAGCDQ